VREAVYAGEKSHLFGLDLLRLLAAALVVLNHFGAFSSARPDVGKPLAFPILNFATGFGWVGVEIFFVISGYVIALSARGASPGGFIKRRALRIFPALWICSFISLIALATTRGPIEELFGAFFRSVTLFPRGPYLDGAVWSLVVEAVFYLLIWLVLLTKRFHQLDAIAAILGIGSAAFLAIFSLAVLRSDTPLGANVVGLFDRFAFKVFLLRYGVFFALGMTLWLGFEYGFTKNRKILGCIFGVFGSIEIAVQSVSAASQTVSPWMIPSLQIIIPIIVWAAGNVILILSVYFREQISHKLERKRGLVKKLGLLTFPLYLNHYTLGRVLVYNLARSNISTPIALALSVIIVCGSSWFIMLIAEPALQAKIRKFLNLDSTVRQEAIRAARLDLT
jgi:peptidoglycan/LPS O-acetylase OafA/YrhL